jgi:hypothetical protein
MDYFQLRKNSRQVIRIFRGPYEGYDITRIQIWYRERDGSEYKPGRIVAFGSETIPGVIEGLVMMASREPKIATPELSPAADLTEAVHAILKAHRRPVHWEVLAEILLKERPETHGSRWAVYNCLLADPARFDQVEEDVFLAR